MICHQSAVTHKDNNPKEKVEMKWTAPEGYDGDVIFRLILLCTWLIDCWSKLSLYWRSRTTFVQERTTFWVQEPSASIQLAPVQPNVNTESAPTIQPNVNTESALTIQPNISAYIVPTTEPTANATSAPEIVNIKIVTLTDDKTSADGAATTPSNVEADRAPSVQLSVNISGTAAQSINTINLYGMLIMCMTIRLLA